MTGYWPPTDLSGMLADFATLQVDYKNSGYDVLAVSATYTQLGTDFDLDPFWGRGTGTLEVDYRDTSADFWPLALGKLPIAIMSFGRGGQKHYWTLEQGARNLPGSGWVLSLSYKDMAGVTKTHTLLAPYPGGSANDASPYKNQGATADGRPDFSKVSNAERSGNLPRAAIKLAIETATGNRVTGHVGSSPDLGSYVCEYMAYHIAWYKDYVNTVKYPADPSKHCAKVGFVHVGAHVTVPDAKLAVEAQLDELIKVLP